MFNIQKMETSEIVRDFLEEMKIYRNNVVINDCDICGRLFRQKDPIGICSECKKMTEVF